tara:strand:+ start:68 stop:352 length:285 start_codon:yes stop_codon:yes gene_type:complete
MIDKLIDKYGTLLNTLRENKSTKNKEDTYDYNTDIKNTREYLKDLKALKQQLTIPVVSQQRELLNALANDFNDSTDTYVGQKRIEDVLKAFNCG